MTCATSRSHECSARPIKSIRPSERGRPTGTVVEVTRRTSPPFRADHVGSLLRPPALMHARAAFAEQRIDADELREVEDVAIAEVVALQETLVCNPQRTASFAGP